MTTDADDFGVDPPERDDLAPFQNGHIVADDEDTDEPPRPDPSTYGRDRQADNYLDLQTPPELLVTPRGQLPPETRKKVTDALRLGLTERLAAQYAGLTYERYLKHRKIDPIFADAVKQAEALGAFAWMARIEQAASGGDWRAAAWKLQHRFPSEYGRQVLEHGGEGGGAIPVRFVTVEVPQGASAEFSEGPDMPPLPEPDIQPEDDA
jgi:hypothetical protein